MSYDASAADIAPARREQADAVRADLANLRRDLATAKQELSGLRTAQLIEANEQQLVLAAVHADSVVRTAFNSVDELTRSTQYDELTGAHLLNNASRRAPQGAEVALTMQSIDGEARVVVSHPRVGISTDALPHVFDLFIVDTDRTTPRRWAPGITVGVSRSMLACASTRTIAWVWSGCCVIARGRPSRWNGCVKTMPST